MNTLHTTQIKLDGCNLSKISSTEFCRAFLVDLVKFIDMTIIPEDMINGPNPSVFNFDAAKAHLPAAEDGVTGVVILCESHCAIHAWNSDCSASIIISSCKKYDPVTTASFCRGYFDAKVSQCDWINIT